MDDEAIQPEKQFALDQKEHAKMPPRPEEYEEEQQLIDSKRRTGDSHSDDYEGLSTGTPADTKTNSDAGDNSNTPPRKNSSAIAYNLPNGTSIPEGTYDSGNLFDPSSKIGIKSDNTGPSQEPASLFNQRGPFPSVAIFPAVATSSHSDTLKYGKGSTN